MTPMEPTDMHRRGRVLGKTPAGGQEQDEEVGVGDSASENATPTAPARTPAALTEAFWCLLLLLIGGAFAGGASALYGSDLGSVPVFVALAALEAVNAFASAWLARRFRVAIWGLDAAFVAVAFFLLPPLGTIVAMSVGMLVGRIVGRRPFIRALGNVGVVLISTTVGVVSFEALGGEADPTSAHAGVAALAAVLLMTVAWELAVGVVFHATDGEPFVAGVVGALRFALPRAPFAASLGYVAGLASLVSQAGALFAVPPMAAMVFVLAEHFRAERDRERAETLFRAATDAHASIEPGEVSDALVKAATALFQAERAELTDRAPSEGEIGAPLSTADDRWLVVSGGNVSGGDPQLLAAVAAIGSSALENARMAEELRHHAVHDALTGLPNQVLFADRVVQAVGAPGRQRFAVVALDLDAFRKVNDSLGHAAGDELLIELAARLQEAVRSGDTVARLSADVFMFLLHDVGTPELAGVLIEKLLATVRRPAFVGGQEVFMTACAGLAFFPDDGREGGHLLRNADSALHRAKANGPGSYEIYAQGMNELAHQRLARESELHQAVRRDELVVRYQPQIDLRTGRIVAVEALVRWNHPTLGLLPPNEFVPLAEESGLIVEVDSSVLRSACRQASAWQAEGLPPVRVAVNMSARHFQSPERLIGTIRDALAESNLPAAFLELEVTEGLAVVEDRSAEILQRVRDLGVSISIDDFGTGYSMLGRLHRFPVDRLKIDRSFVREITSAHTEAPIVSAIVAMARSLGMETVAEGVETLEQQTYLRNRSCDMAQGFLFSHPVEPSEISRLLRTSSVGFNLSQIG
jgi:diguanylate cyclase (GGDEF)-like protein